MPVARAYFSLRLVFFFRLRSLISKARQRPRFLFPTIVVRFATNQYL